MSLCIYDIAPWCQLWKRNPQRDWTIDSIETGYKQQWAEWNLSDAVGRLDNTILSSRGIVVRLVWAVYPVPVPYVLVRAIRIHLPVITLSYSVPCEGCSYFHLRNYIIDLVESLSRSYECVFHSVVARLMCRSPMSYLKALLPRHSHVVKVPLTLTEVATDGALYGVWYRGIVVCLWLYMNWYTIVAHIYIIYSPIICSVYVIVRAEICRVTHTYSLQQTRIRYPNMEAVYRFPIWTLYSHRWAVKHQQNIWDIAQCFKINISTNTAQHRTYANMLMQ